MYTTQTLRKTLAQPASRPAGPPTRLGSPLVSSWPLAAGRRRSRRFQSRVLAFKEDAPPASKGQPASGPAVPQTAGPEPAAGPRASVTFRACRHVPFGHVLKLVGGPAELGAWDCEQAPAMQWSEGDQWLLTLDLPAGQHEFKLVAAQGRAGCVDWEPGANRVLQVPAAEASARGAFSVVCEWGATQSSLEKLPGAEAGAEERLSESEEPALRPEDLTAEPYAAPGDEGESPTTTVGKMTIEGAPAGKQQQQGQPPAGGQPMSQPAPASASSGSKGAKPAAAPKAAASAGSKGEGKDKAGAVPASGKHAAVKMVPGDYPSQTPMGEGADDALGGEPAGGLKPSTEAAVKQELQKAAAAAAGRHQPGLLSRFLQSLSMSKDGGEDDDDYGDSGGSGGEAGSSKPPAASRSTSGAVGRAAEGKVPAPPPPPPPPSPPKRRLQGEGEEPPPGGNVSAFTAPAEPSAGLQLAVAAAGLAALPVVAWSEFVLKSTGCGLPPGPSGLLGAAEGVSYLVVGGIALWSLGRKISTGSGLPAGPGGALGAAEGGSWLAVAAGLVVLALQWQTYGYIPSALPDNNCFGGQQASASSSYNLAQQPGARAAAALGDLAAAPSLTSGAGSAQTASSYHGPLRLPAGGSWLPQGNLLFSAAEGVLSQSGSIIETAETAAAAMAAAAAGQPPPAAVAAAVEHLKARALQAQQLASAITSRAMGEEAAGVQAQQVMSAPAPGPAVPPAAAASQLEPLHYSPPRDKVRAALKSGWAALQHNEKLQAVLEPYPLPAVARQAAATAGGAIDAAQQAAEASMRVVEHEQKRAVGSALGVAQRGGQELRAVAAAAGERLEAALPPQMRAWVPHLAAPPAPAPAAPAPATAADAAAPASGKAAAGAAKPAAAGAAKPAAAGAAKPAAAGASAAASSSSSPAKTGSSKATAGEAAAAAAPPAKPSSAVGVEMFASVVSDLKEGYAGLWQATLEFNPQQAAQSVHERIVLGQQQAQRAQQAAAAKAAAAASATSSANGKPATASSSGTAAGAAKTAVPAGTAAPLKSSKVIVAAADPAATGSSKPGATKSTGSPAAASPATKPSPSPSAGVAASSKPAAADSVASAAPAKLALPKLGAALAAPAPAPAQPQVRG